MVTLPKIPGITIDGLTSKDLDDAIWLEPDGSGWLLHVSISHVAGKVRVGGKCDQIALSRAFTRYHAAGSRPMLPRSFAEDKLSLLPDTARRVVVTTIPISADGELGECTIHRAILDNRGRYSYPEVADLLENHPGHQHYGMIKQAAELANLRLEKRRANGALAFYDLRRGWATTEEGFYRKIRPDEANISHIIIQEFMVATGTTVAAYCARLRIQGLFRNHLASVLAPNREQLIQDIANATIMPVKNLQALFDRINMVVERATVGPTILGHYGLNLPAYMSVTSPIRRYSDLINQRQILAHLRGDEPVYGPAELEAIAQVVNQVEREIKDAVHKRYKEQHQREIERDLQRAAFLGLSTDRFFDVLIKAVTHGPLPPSLIESLEQRLDGNHFGPRELFVLLLTVPPTPEVSSLQQRALDQLAENPGLAPTILSMANQKLGWSTVEYKTRQVGPSHMPVFHIVATVQIPDESGEKRPLSSDEVQAGTVRLAERQAGLSLIGRYLGLASSAPITPDPSEPAPVVESDPPLPGGNPKGELIEFCHGRGWGKPTYEHSFTGLPHAREFTATAAVTIDALPYTASGSPFRSIKEAEQSAAQELLKQLTAKFGSAPPAELLPSTPDGYINAVQELCVARRWALPKYDFNHVGNIHSCTATISLPDTTEPVTRHAHCPTKKEAKHQAALKLYQVLAKL